MLEIIVQFIVPFAVGALCLVLGIINRKGNINSLHSYHRNRVSEEDRLPFGKTVGLGTIIIGCGIMAFSVLSAVAALVGNDVFTLVGTGVMIAALAVGLGISFYAMIKYNKGIF